MKKFLIFTFIIISVLFFNTSFAYNACKQWNMMVEYECQDSSCNSTKTEYHPRDSSQQYYTVLKNFTKIGYSVFNYINSNINWSNRNITEDNYCKNPSVDSKWILSCDSVYDKIVKISDLLYADHSIYLITGSKDKNWDYPIWEYKKFNDGWDLLDFYNVKIQVPNVCIDSDCNPTNYSTYNATSSLTFNMLAWWYKDNINLTQLDEPDVISWWLSSNNYKIWLTTNPVTINATFRDYIPSGCNNAISYTLQSISPSWEVYMEFKDIVSSDNANVTILKETPNYIEWKISEWFRFNVIGNSYIRAKITDWYPNSVIKNSSYISVVAWDSNISQSRLLSMQSRVPWIKYYAKSTTTSWSILSYEIYLKDISGNPITLPIKIQPTNNIDKIINYPTWNINPDWYGKFSFTIQFNNKTNSYFEEFNIIVPNTDNYWAVNGLFTTIKLSADSNPLPIYSDLDPWNDFDLSCTNKNIKIIATCTWDDLSWCASNETLTFTSNNDNGKTWILYLKDIAGNNTNWFRYEINHIDKTAPILTSFTMWWKAASVKANPIMNLALDLADYTPSQCNPVINYSLNLNNLKTIFVKNWNINSPYNFSFYYDFSKIWNASVGFILKDVAWNITTTSKHITIVPDNVNTSTSLIQLVNSSQKSTLYPWTSYNYQVILKDKYGNPIYWKTMDAISYQWTSAIRTNMIDIDTPTWSDAYNIILWNTTTDSAWKASFNFYSKAPWIFNEKFWIRLNNWDDNYTDLDIQSVPIIWWWDANYFLKPWIWKMTMVSPVWNNLALSSVNKVKIWVIKKAPSAFTAIYSIENFKDKMQAANPIMHKVTDKQDALDLTSNPIMQFRLDSNSDQGNNIKPWVEVGPYINYNIGWTDIKYLLSETENSQDISPIWINNPDEAMMWVRIVWSSQWSGKNSIVTWKNNFSDISKSDTRTLIRKKAIILTKWMKSWNWINWIFYKDCSGSDYQLPSIPIYETLILKNCNLTIKSDINIAWKKSGIILLRDDQSKETLANIYVDRNVKYINAIIYADGWFISSWFNSSQDRVENYKDSEDRINDLQKQLVFKWTLFTRNTIWWAILGSLWKYIIPWWAKTDNFNKALMYDLNYIRRQNVWWNLETETKKYNKWFQEPFVIIYNPIIQTDPPKWFAN